MKRVALIAVVALTVLGCVPPSAPSTLDPRTATSGLRVMTYNLLGAQADDRVFDEHAGVAARVDQLRPDVLVLQEAQSDDVVALLTRTSTKYRLASYLQWNCDTKPAPEGVAILVRDTITVSDSGRRHVGETCVNPTVRRVLVWADLELPGGPVRVYGTHLTAGSGPAGESRIQQIREIRNQIAGDDPSNAGRWLFAGDMNTAPGKPDFRLITDGEPGADSVAMTDTFAEISVTAADPAACPTLSSGDAAGLAFLMANPTLVAACGYTAGWPKDDNFFGCDVLSWCTSWQQRAELPVRDRIDDVFRSRTGPVRAINGFVPNPGDSDWAAPGAEWFRLSDHLPYVVDVDIAAS